MSSSIEKVFLELLVCSYVSRRYASKNFPDDDNLVARQSLPRRMIWKAIKITICRPEFGHSLSRWSPKWMRELFIHQMDQKALVVEITHNSHLRRARGGRPFWMLNGHDMYGKKILMPYFYDNQYRRSTWIVSCASPGIVVIEIYAFVYELWRHCYDEA